MRRLTVELQMVGQDRAARGRVGQHAERLQVGHEPDLAHRAHSRNGLQLVEPTHRLHRDRQPDAGLEARLEPVATGSLRAHGPVVAAPEEADEAKTRLVCLLDNVCDGHTHPLPRT
jgi:hypothetical protein